MPPTDNRLPRVPTHIDVRHSAPAVIIAFYGRSLPV